MQVEGALNFRDAAVGPVRPGRLLRSDTVQFLTPTDVEFLVETVGLRTIIDLRLDFELVTEGRGLLAETEVRHHHLPFTVDGTRMEGNATPILHGDDPMVPHYLGYLESTPQAVTGVFAVLAEEESVPVVIHCAAGKDRTGVAVAMVLSVCGVDDATIAREYATGSEKVPAVFERLRTLDSYGDTVMQLPPKALLAEEASMLSFLAEVRRLHGGVENYLLDNGITTHQLDRVRSAFLD